MTWQQRIKYMRDNLLLKEGKHYAIYVPAFVSSAEGYENSLLQDLDALAEAGYTVAGGPIERAKDQYLILRCP